VHDEVPVKSIRWLLASAVLVFSGLASSAEEHNVHPPQGLGPDARTAIAIAVAVWTPIYGEKQIASEKPYGARLEGDKWTVTGSLPKGWRGGVAIAVIAKSDGRVLRVTHGR
jgi:hypothetical protein